MADPANDPQAPSTPNVQDVLSDPNFQGLELPEKHKVLLRVDPNYAGLEPKEQAQALNRIHYGTPIQPPGFASTLGSDLLSTVTQPVKQLLNPKEWTQPTDPFATKQAELEQSMAQRKKEGRSLPYRVLADVSQVAGVVDPTGMEESARQGDPGGVLGHAAAQVTQNTVPFVIGEAAKIPGKITEMMEPGRIARMKSVINDVAGKTPADLDFNAKVDSVMPDIADVARKTKFDTEGNARVGEFQQQLEHKETEIWRNEHSPQINRQLGVPINLSSIKADAQAQISSSRANVNPTEAAAAQKWLDNYFQNSTKTVGEADQDIRSLNDDLAKPAEPYGPIVKSVKQSTVRGLRSGVENALQNQGEQGVGNPNSRWGNLREVSDAIGKRLNVAANKPLSAWDTVLNARRAMFEGGAIGAGTGEVVGGHSGAAIGGGIGAATGFGSSIAHDILSEPGGRVERGMRGLAKTSLQPPNVPGAPPIRLGPVPTPPTPPPGPTALTRNLLPPGPRGTGPTTVSGPGQYPIQLGSETPRPLTGPSRQLPPEGGTSTPKPEVPLSKNKVWQNPGPQQLPESPLQPKAASPSKPYQNRLFTGVKPSESISPYLDGLHEFSLFSAENPHGQQLSPTENKIRTAQNLNELRKLGYSPQTIEGVEDGKGGTTSIFVPGMTTDDALVFQEHMARTQGYEKQQTVLTKQGLIDVANRKVAPINFSKTKFGDEAETQPFHSVATGGGERLPFSLHLSGEPGQLKEPVELEHHSNASLKTGDYLLGSKRGAINSELGRPAGSEATRLNKGDGAPPGSYFYEKGTRAEPQIAARKHTYILKGEKSIATLEETPEFKSAMQQAFQDAKAKGSNDTDAQHIALNAGEWAVKNAGYDGYRSSQYPGNVFMFGDHQIFKPGEEPPPPNLIPHPNLPPEFQPPAGEATSPTKSPSKPAAPSTAKTPGSKSPGPTTKPAATPPTQAKSPAVGKVGEKQAKIETAQVNRPEWIAQQIDGEISRLKKVIANPKATPEELKIAQNQLDNYRGMIQQPVATPKISPAKTTPPKTKGKPA